MKPPSTLARVLRTLRPAPLCALGTVAIIAWVAMIPHSSLAAAQPDDGKPGDNPVTLRPCFDPHASPAGGGASRPSPCKDRNQLTGEELFELPFPGARNERSCATCHVPEDNFTLTPAHVERLLQKNPKDPLFNAIDADDPNAKTLTYEHLKKGLIRVWLTLPANMDLIDEGGNVTTPSDRKIFVWRAVPSIADVALTAPYQLDGREATLEQQAQGAVTSHSQGGTISRKELARIADFERTVFSSERARWVARGAAFDVEDMLVLTPAETRGREVYKNVCASCHGGGNKTTIVDRVVHDMAFPLLKSDGSGTVAYQVPATTPSTALLAAQPHNEFINVGSADENYLAQMGQTEHVSFTKDLSYPIYRFRFYTDASRQVVTAELPPALPPENPFKPGVDADKNPINGPNFSPQLYTTDPGRAAITGNPYDFEAFDIPTLRGIAKTAPYWHNHISGTLAEVVELYSDHLLTKFPTLTQPGEKEPDPDGDIGPEQAMTRQQKDDLVAFLKRL